MDELKRRVDGIRERLAEASERWGRAPELMAVSKTVPAARVNPLAAMGVTRLGENRAQEILEKLPELDATFRVDLIGRLQTNKVRAIIDKVAMIQSVDRPELAREIDRRAGQHGLTMPVLIQVNIGDEPQKGGVAVGELTGFAREIARLPGLRVSGLMAVMPNLGDGEALRPYFKRMRALFDGLREEAIDGVFMEELSMGMSGDYVIAAEEGATLVRVGSAIFGERRYDAKD